MLQKQEMDSHVIHKILIKRRVVTSSTAITVTEKVKQVNPWAGSFFTKGRDEVIDFSF